MATNLAEELSDIELIESLLIAEARDNFWAFRKLMRPTMVVGWFQWDLAHKLQQFYESLVLGQRPVLIIQAPPQHGKSVSVVDFIAWMSGRCPFLKSGFASYSDMLGVKTNLHLQRTFNDPRFKQVFPHFAVPSKKDNAQVNRSKIEFLGTDGSFRNTTIGGGITGEPLDVGIIDDPLKGREQANSPTIREKVWNWFTDDFSTRFSEYSGLLIVMTRWHLDDLVGRFLEQNPGNVSVVTYQAVAEADEDYREGGQPLFPELKSLKFLNEIKSRQASFSWNSLYQQKPTEQGGNLIKSSYFRMCAQIPTIQHRIIYCDTAQKTKEANDYTVFECWGKMNNGDIILLDLVRGKWDSVDLECQAVAFWNKHNQKVNGFDPVSLGKLRSMKVEDKVSGTGLIQKLKRVTQIPVQGIQRNTDKYTRLCDNLGYIEAGRVWLPANAPWLSEFLSECEAFCGDMSHKFDDQIDPMLDAIEDMIATQKVSFYE